MLPKNSLLIRRLTCLSILLLLSPLAHALEIKGVRLPKKIKANENELVLNGGALRSVWGFKVYVAGLYLKKNSKDEKHIMAEDRESKRIHITMLREVSGKKFETTIQESIDANLSSSEKRKFASELKAFLKCFSGGSALKKKSTVNIDYLPEQGTKVSVDKNVFDLIPGDEFYHVLLRLWIGKPTQESMKSGLLGRG